MKNKKCYHETSLGFCPFKGKDTDRNRPKSTTRQAAGKVLKDFDEMIERIKPYLPKCEIRTPKHPQPWQSGK